jgi:hypothetical protein
MHPEVSQMPVSADEYWTSYELGTARNLVDSVRLAKKAASEDLSSWVWRGQANAAWGLHSSLSRILRNTLRRWPEERDLVDAEAKLFASAEQWGLGWASRGRLSALELLALIRHHGSPSRFIDVSGSLAIALHDACAPIPDTDDRDARVFAFDGEGQVLTDHIANLESGPLNREPAWWTAPPDWWITSYTVWRAPAIDDRIVRQQGAFLISGVPTTTGNQKWYLQGHGPGSGTRYLNPLTAAEVLDVTSVGVRCHGAAGRGARPDHPVRNFRIAAGAKEQILRDLRALFGLSAAGIYPDAAGFVKFGVPEILPQM